MKEKVLWRKAEQGEIRFSSLQGYITITYGELVEKLGPPHDTDIDGKVQAEWRLMVSGAPCTIYDYKHLGGLHTVKDWHIGGHDTVEACKAVKDLFPNHKIVVPGMSNTDLFASGYYEK